MNSEVIGVIFTGIIGILTAIGGLQFQRGRRTEKVQSDLLTEFKTMKKTVAWLQRRDIANTQHVYALERSMASAGLPIPERPAILNEDTMPAGMVVLNAGDDG